MYRSPQQFSLHQEYPSVLERQPCWACCQEKLIILMVKLSVNFFHFRITSSGYLKIILNFIETFKIDPLASMAIVLYYNLHGNLYLVLIGQSQMCCLGMWVQPSSTSNSKNFLFVSFFHFRFIYQ